MSKVSRVSASKTETTNTRVSTNANANANASEKTVRGRKKVAPKETQEQATQETQETQEQETQKQETRETQEIQEQETQKQEDNVLSVSENDDGDDEKTEFVTFSEKEFTNQETFRTHHRVNTNTQETRPQRQNFIKQRQPRTQNQQQSYQTNSSLKFSYDEILQKGDTKLSENNTETLLKYLIATTHKAGQTVLCKVFKNTLTGMKNETTLPMTTYRTNYTRQTRKV
jgi:hypothetical protein